MFIYDRQRCITLFVFLVCVLLFPARAQSAPGPWTCLTPTPTGNTLNDAYSPDGGTTIYHVGDGGLILKQVGTTFTSMESGTTAPLKGIAGSGPTDIWAVGGSQLSKSNTDPIRSVLLHFDGTTWTATTRTDATAGVSTWSDGVLTQHPIAGIGSGVAVTAFKAFSATAMWFSGVSDSNRILLRGDGTTWTSWQPPGAAPWSCRTSSRPPEVPTPSSNYNYATVGIPCVVGGESLQCPTSEGQDAYRYAALAAGPTMLVAVGVNGSAFYNTDGATWQAVDGAPRHDSIDGTPLYEFTAVVHAGSDVFWAVLTSSSHWTDGGTSSLYRIQNGQATLVQGNFTNPLNALTVAPDRQVVFAAGSHGVIMTTNARFTETGTFQPALLLLLLD